MSISNSPLNVGDETTGSSGPENTAASVSETRRAIDEALASTGYSCKTVSWDDVSRGTVSGSLSCWGSNITDTYLKAKDGTPLFTVRSDNWNEKLGVVQSGDVALLIGNCEAHGSLRNITLKQFLDDPATCGASYTGMKEDVKLSDISADKKVSIRFQTVFLPVEEDETGRGTMQFAAEAYNYSTLSDEDPRNLVVLATTQGLSVQADGAGAKRLLLHAGAPDDVNEYWLEAESSQHKVGGEQKESEEEREDALKRGKATSEVIGIKAMGTRFNVLVTIQIPLTQKPSSAPGGAMGTFGGTGMLAAMQKGPIAMLSSCAMPPPSAFAAMNETMEAGAEDFDLDMDECEVDDDDHPIDPILLTKAGFKRTGREHPSSYRPKEGRASAARVSRGDFYAKHKGLSVKEPKRNVNEHVTVTCVLYNTVIAGVPNESDVLAAVEDMEKLFAACSESGRLADAGFNFMKKELTVGDVLSIQEKVTTQAPSAPPPVAEPAPISAKELVVAKIASLEGVPRIAENEILELRLLTLGAVKDDNVKKLLGTKFDLLDNKIKDNAADGARNVLHEIKLLVLGALS